jgi:chitin disaccharide deacetylase
VKREGQLMTAAPNKFAAPTEPVRFVNPGKFGKRSDEGAASGFLILNADDWGRDTENTDRTLDCFSRGAMSSVSAMVFMEDSQRAAEIAREKGIDAGLHLNFTMAFSAPQIPARLSEHQQRLARHLQRHRLSPVLFHPGLIRSFEYVVAAQREEFCRLYGGEPKRLDGHHHMHLCANVLLQRLLPAGTIVRRNFSFQPGEKGFYNRAYRKIVDGILARRHRLTDMFFSLPPLGPPVRLERMFSLAGEFAVEVETHPVNPEEHRFLTEGEILRFTEGRPISRCYAVRE